MQQLIIERVNVLRQSRNILGAGGGKALRNDQLVLTPSGWVRIDSLSVGDLIVTPKGTTTRITGVFPQGTVELYEITTSDERVSVACKDHLWKCWYLSDVEQVVTTSVLSNMMQHGDVYIPVACCDVSSVSIESIVQVEDAEATCISIEDEDHLFITNDFIVTHNTWSILVDNLAGVHDPDYFSIFFRKTNTELDNGLWIAAKKIYKDVLFTADQKPIGKAHVNEQSKIITFPSGARSKFSYCMYDKDADSHYGNEYTKIYFDELQQHSQYVFDTLRSRNRSVAKVLKGMRCTLNPDTTHFVYEWIKPYLDEDGFPIKELSGKIRYFLIVNGILYTDWDAKVLQDMFPPNAKGRKKQPQTYTYIPSTLEDNTILQELDPEYYEVLDSMPERKRKQLLLGCWSSDVDSGMYFNRKWLKKATALPMGSRGARGWDLAGGVDEPEKGIFPDYTASTKMYKTTKGEYYIAGSKKFKMRAGSRDEEILRICEEDTSDIVCVIPQDGGSAGKQVCEDFLRKLSIEGFVGAKDSAPQNAPKIKKFEAFSIAAEQGLVYILEDTFEPDELEVFYTQLEMFNGKGSTRTRKDDYVDSTSTVFNYLNKKLIIPDFTLPEIHSRTKMASLKDIHTR